MITAGSDRTVGNTLVIGADVNNTCITFGYKGEPIEYLVQAIKRLQGEIHAVSPPPAAEAADRGEGGSGSGSEEWVLLQRQDWAVLPAGEDSSDSKMMETEAPSPMQNEQGSAGAGSGDTTASSIIDTYLHRLRHLRTIKHLVILSEPPAPIPTFLLQAVHHMRAAASTAGLVAQAQHERQAISQTAPSVAITDSAQGPARPKRPGTGLQPPTIADPPPPEPKISSLLFPNVESITLGPDVFNVTTHSRLIVFYPFYQALLLSTSPRQICMTLNDEHTAPPDPTIFCSNSPNRRLPASHQLSGLIEDIGKKGVWRGVREISIHGDLDNCTLLTMDGTVTRLFFRPITSAPAASAASVNDGRQDRQGQATRYHMATPHVLLPPPTPRLIRAGAIRKAIDAALCIKYVGGTGQSRNVEQSSVGGMDAPAETAGTSASSNTSRAGSSSSGVAVNTQPIKHTHRRTCGRQTLRPGMTRDEIMILGEVRAYNAYAGVEPPLPVEYNAEDTGADWIQNKIRRWIDDVYGKYDIRAAGIAAAGGDGNGDGPASPGGDGEQAAGGAGADDLGKEGNQQRGGGGARGLSEEIQRRVVFVSSLQSGDQADQGNQSSETNDGCPTCRRSY